MVSFLLTSRSAGATVQKVRFFPTSFPRIIVKTSHSIALYLALLLTPVVTVTILVALLNGTSLSIAGTSVAIATLSTGIMITLIWILQWLLPYFSEKWRRYEKDLVIDGLHAYFSTGWGKKAADVLVLFVAAEMSVGRSLLDGIPIAVLFPAGLVIGDLGAYVVHRIFHHYKIVWPIHAIHHTPGMLNPSSSGRSHPVNVISVWLVQSIPLVLLGFPTPVLVGVAVWTSTNGLLQHCNIDFRLGWLEDYLIAGPLFHRWHHSKNPLYYRQNLGSNLVIYDRLFGTFHLPKDVDPDEDVGVPEVDLARRPGLWGQVTLITDHMLAPVVPGYYKRLERKKQEANS